MISGNRDFERKHILYLCISFLLLVCLIFLLNPKQAYALQGYNAGLQTMEHPELLPFWLPNGTETKQFISYDTTSGNDDGGFNKFHRYIDSNGEWVFFDEYGPGSLYRMQMNIWAPVFGNTAVDPSARIKLYFDNETTPRLNMTFDQFFGLGQNYTTPFTQPLSFFDNTTGTYGNNRFAINYYPFPFKQRLKITMSSQPTENPNKWYQFTYLKFPSGTEVNTWTGTSEDSAIVRSQWNNIGADPKSAAGNVTVNNAYAIPKNTSSTVFDLPGQGSIASLNFTIAPYNKDLFTHAKIKIYWDNSTVPAVDMSLGSFFGGGGDTIGTEDVYNKNFANLFYGFNGTGTSSATFYAYWPMPFWTHARIVIENNSLSDITSFQSNVKYKPSSSLSYPSGQAGYFHAKRTVDVSPDSVPFSRAFEETGRGKVVGLMFYSTGYSMDGDEFTYIDDSGTPQIHGDGTEDDHNQGWGGDAYQKPLWGGLINGYNGGYRTYYNDSYIFNKDIKINYEHSNLGGGTSGQKTDAIVYYYKDDASLTNLSLTDQLDVGSPTSETGHGYSINTQTWSGSTDSGYDGYEQKPDYFHVNDSGRSNKGYSQFTVGINSDNTGVKLRKRVSRYNNNVQQADVYIDGVKVTEYPWYFADLNSDSGHAFIDSDFDVPASYTSGKSSITVKIVYQSATDTANGINEYYYWVYSYGIKSAGTNIALGATATASSQWDANYSPDKANDNSLSTRWNSALGTAAGEWLALDFGSAKTFNRVEIEQETGYTRISSYKIQYWNGSAWVDAYTGGVMSDTQTDSFPAVTSQKIRLLVNATTGNTPTIREFKVFGTSAGNSGNLAIGASASASSQWDPSYSPDKANDDSLSTRWNSVLGSAAGEWLALDFGSAKTFNQVQFEQETTWTRINSYKVQIWNGSAWADAYAGGTMNDTQTDTFPAVTSQKVRLLVNGTTGNTPTIKEFRVFNTGGSHTDDFTGGVLNPSWSWVREDSANWSLTANPGFIRINAQPGDVYSTGNNAKNLLLRNAPSGDWTMVAKMTFNPAANYQQAGLVAYQDDDNYVKLTRAYSNGNVISAAKEISQSYTQSLPVSTATTIYLRMAKTGTAYTLSYNTDGSANWTQAAQYTGINLGTAYKIGLVSFGGPAGANADFDWVDIQQ